MFAASAAVTHVMAVAFTAVTTQLLLPNDTATAPTSGEKPESSKEQHNKLCTTGCLVIWLLRPTNVEIPHELLQRQILSD